MSVRRPLCSPLLHPLLAASLIFAAAACGDPGVGNGDQPGATGPDAGSPADATAPDVSDDTDGSAKPDADDPSDTTADATACPSDDRCETPGERRCAGDDLLECTRESAACATWETVETCSEGLTCSEGACTETCTDQCPKAGATGCDGDGVRTCDDHDDDGCLEWSETSDCAAGESCSDGTCEPVCRDGDGVCPDACDASTDADCGPTCGDGDVEGSEECDDGNTDDGDGCSSTCQLEHGTTKWAINYGGGQYRDYARELAVDSKGNVYVAGSFAEEIDFNGEVRQANDTSDDSSGAYLVKYDDRGNYQWAETFGGNGRHEEATGVAVDSNDDVYLTGWYTNRVTIGSRTLPYGDFDMFLAKFDSAGNYQWSGVYPGAYPEDVAVDGADNLYVTGNTENAFLGSSPPSGDPADLFVTKFDSQGNTTWSATPKSSTRGQYGHAVDVDGAGNVYVTGGHEGDFEMPSNNVTLPHHDPAPDYLTDKDLFVMKLDASGKAQWGRAAGDFDADVGLDIQADPTGGAAVAGYYEGGESTWGGEPLKSSGSEADIVLANFDENGSAEWLKTFGGTDAVDQGRGVGVDAAGNVYMTGYFDGSVDFGAGTAHSSGAHSTIVASYDNSGTHRWSEEYSSGEWERPADLLLGGTDRLYVTGRFDAPLDFGTGRLDPTTDNQRVFLVSLIR